MLTLTPSHPLAITHAEYDLFDCAFLLAYRLPKAVFPYQTALLHYRDGFVYFRQSLRQIVTEFTQRWLQYRLSTAEEELALFAQSRLQRFHYTSSPHTPYCPVRCLWTPNRYDQPELYLFSPMCQDFTFTKTGMQFTTRLEDQALDFTAEGMRLDPYKCTTLAAYCAQLPALAYQALLPQFAQMCYDFGYPLPPDLQHHQLYSRPWLPLARKVMVAHPQWTLQLLGGSTPGNELGALMFLFDFVSEHYR